MKEIMWLSTAAVAITAIVFSNNSWWSLLLLIPLFGGIDPTKTK